MEHFSSKYCCVELLGVVGSIFQRNAQPLKTPENTYLLKYFKSKQFPQEKKTLKVRNPICFNP